jgi:hypothetical protein
VHAGGALWYLPPLTSELLHARWRRLLNKPALRKEMRRRRRALTPRQQKLAAWFLYRRLVVSAAFRYGKRIAFSLANDGEIDAGCQAPRSAQTVLAFRNHATALYCHHVP